jgi:hypothetical protein
MSIDKEMPKVLFWKNEKRRKLSIRDQPLAIKWCDVRDVYLLSTAHDDWTVQTPK